MHGRLETSPYEKRSATPVQKNKGDPQAAQVTKFIRRLAHPSPRTVEREPLFG
jgi:hypothetical protein